MEPLRIHLRAPGPVELSIGQGVPSGPGGQWRVIDVLTSAPLTVYYPDGSYQVEALHDWVAMPEVGVQVICAPGGVWKNADEYLYQGQAPRYGLYIEDEIYKWTMRQAIG